MKLLFLILVATLISINAQDRLDPEAYLDEITINQNADRIEIYDVLGERLFSTEDTALRQAQQPRSRSAEISNGWYFSGYFDYAQQPLKIDISHLPRGVYIVRIGDRVEKFVKK